MRKITIKVILFSTLTLILINLSACKNPKLVNDYNYLITNNWSATIPNIKIIATTPFKVPQTNSNESSVNGNLPGQYIMHFYGEIA